MRKRKEAWAKTWKHINREEKLREGQGEGERNTAAPETPFFLQAHFRVKRQPALSFF